MDTGDPPRQENSPVLDTGLACLTLLLRYLQVGAEPDQLRHQAGRGSELLSAGDMIRLAKQLDVRAKARQATFDKLPRLPLPAIAEARDGSFFILAQVAEDAALIQVPGEKGPRKLTRDALEALWGAA